MGCEQIPDSEPLVRHCGKCFLFVTDLNHSDLLLWTTRFVLKRSCHRFSSKFPYVFQLNAMANRAAGKGYENEDNYSNIKFQFIGIENIHVMRNSLQKMLEGNIHWKLEENNWSFCQRNQNNCSEISSSEKEYGKQSLSIAAACSCLLANGTCAMEHHGKYWLVISWLWKCLVSWLKSRYHLMTK